MRIKRTNKRRTKYRCSRKTHCKNRKIRRTYRRKVCKTLRGG